MNYYLLLQGDTDYFYKFKSKRDALEYFRGVALELDRYGQKIEATLHKGPHPAEYPDYVLSLGPRRGLKVEVA